MCQTPNTLPDGTLVGCRGCWQCRQNKIDDWVGRCIAESQTSVACHSITLTYGRDQDGNVDHLRAAVLTYSDVQKYFKRLRVDGYPCRYIAVGEYGAVKGRSHWHLIVYWLKRVPPHEASSRDVELRFAEKHWPHGWSYWEPIVGNEAMSAESAIRYVCKYIQKDVGDMERQGHLAMSKKPPIGSQYFKLLAGQYVKQGLAPQDLYYRFAGCVGGDGKPKQFMLRPGSKTADIFCASYLEQWAAAYGTKFVPSSPVIEEYEDRQARPTVEAYKWQRVQDARDAEQQAKVRRRRFDPFYGPGFNLHPRPREGGSS